MLNVKKLDPNATLPTLAHPGEDLAYDLYALEHVTLRHLQTNRIRTGIAAQARIQWVTGSGEQTVTVVQPLGLLIRDRSSMASKGIMVSGGVIDPGYTGEIQVVMTLVDELCRIGGFHVYDIHPGDKIAQMIPIMLLTGPVVEVQELKASSRGEGGFGSTGK